MKLLKNNKGFGAIEALLLLVIVGIIGGTGFYVYSANKQEPKISDSSIQQKENTVQAEEEAVPELIEYEEGVEIKKPDDVEKLEGASDSFKSFIREEITRLNGKEEGCWSISVLVIYNDEFAGGGQGADGSDVDNCFGAGRTVWVKQNGKWSLDDRFGGNGSAPLCSDVKKMKIPKEVEPQCFDSSKPGQNIDNPN